LPLSLQTEKHRVAEVRFEAAAQRARPHLVLVLLDPNPSSELFSYRPDVSIRFETLEWDWREIRPKLQHRELSRSGALPSCRSGNERLPVRQLNDDGIPGNAIGDRPDGHHQSAAAKAEVHDVQQRALASRGDSRDHVERARLELNDPLLTNGAVEDDRE